MNKLNALKSVVDFLPANGNLDQFYSVQIWKTNEITLQGQYSSTLAQNLKLYGDFSIGVSGYVEAEITLNPESDERIIIKIVLT